MNRRLSRIPMSLLSMALFMVTLMLSARTVAAAPVVITKSNYKLTYADGWSSVGGLQSDTVYAVMNIGLGGVVAYGEGLPLSSGMDATLFAQYLTAAYTSHFVRIDSTNKTLGANAFQTVGLRDTSSKSDTTSRIRIYVTSKGSFVFVSWVMYKSKNEAAAVAQQEAALASLNITATAGIRMAPVSIAPTLPRAIFDIQGRSRLPAGNRLPEVAIFRKL